MSRPEQKDTGRINASGVAYAEIIRERRKAKGLNQEELGAMVSVRKNAVGAWESGRSNPTPTAKKLMFLISQDHSLIQKL